MLENTEEESKMDNPEKLTTIGYIKRKQTKQNKTQYVLNTTIRKETQIM